MEFLCYHRDRPDSLALRRELLEEHWSYMDRFAEELIARGPTLDDDGVTWLGTAVLLRAPDLKTARGVLTVERYADVEVHGWTFGGRPS